MFPAVAQTFAWLNGTIFGREGPPPLRREIFDPDVDNHFVSGALADTFMIPRNPPATVYARVGDLFSQVMLGLAGLVVALRAVKRRG